MKLRRKTMTPLEYEMTPLDHDNATAIVSITGLALGCYNQCTQNYEVGFLRHDCHALTIEVKKKLPYGEEDSVMMYEIKDYQHRIFIDAENAVSPRDPIYTVGNDFDRTQAEADPEDFRWVIDFETNLNGGEPVELQPPGVPVTEMYISKPRLYGDKKLLTEAPFQRVTLDAGGNPIANKTENFGFFTEGIMADITCQDGGAVILRIDGPQGFQVHLPHADGPHEICIKNICPPKANEGDDTGDDPDDDDNAAEAQPTDFSLYYLLIKDTGGEKYDLQSPVHGEGAVCNGSNLGGRANLFPLPASNT
jgi:hypothetical protein